MTIPTPKLLEQSLEHAGYKCRITSTRTISVDGLQEVIEILLADDRRIVAKIDTQSSLDRLEKEASGLLALKSVDVLAVPNPHSPCIVGDRSVLLMDALDVVDRSEVDDCVWERFGRELAEHHLVPCGDRYGWKHNNYIGRTPQPNTWCENWVEFNAQHRLGFQLQLAKDRDLLEGSESEIIHQVINRLNEFIPENPMPSLLHGDLWSGNALSARIAGKTKIAIIDPAVYIGDGWADIAMMKLFGGFSDACFRSYSEAMHGCEGLEKRLLVYQLYHMLNHLNLFGRGYTSSVMTISQQLVR